MQVRKYVFGVAAILSLVAVIAAVYISRIVYRPVRKLMVAMQEVSAGEMATRAEVVSNDEIGLAAKEFNRMLDRIEELDKAADCRRKEEKGCGTGGTGSNQITPHFMIIH